MSKKKILAPEEEFVEGPAGDASDEAGEVEEFFQTFAGGGEYLIQLRRVVEGKGLKPKMEWLQNYYSEVPSLEEIREAWGGGTYVFYAKRDGRLSTLRVNIASKPGRQPSDEDAESRLIDKMVRIKELIGGGNSNNEILIRLIEAQNRQAEQNAKQLIESEQRMMKVIESMRSSGSLVSQLNELLKLNEIVDGLRGGSGGDEDTVLDILESDVVRDLVGQFTGRGGNGGSVDVKNISGGSLPDAFKQLVTRENRDQVIAELVKHNAGRLDRVIAERLVDEILSEKGV